MKPHRNYYKTKPRRRAAGHYFNGGNVLPSIRGESLRQTIQATHSNTPRNHLTRIYEKFKVRNSISQYEIAKTAQVRNLGHPDPRTEGQNKESNLTTGNQEI